MWLEIGIKQTEGVGVNNVDIKGSNSLIQEQNDNLGSVSLENEIVVLRASIEEKDKRIAKLEEALKLAELTFRNYEHLHLNKRTESALEKAEANRLLANKMEQALKEEQDNDK